MSYCYWQIDGCLALVDVFFNRGKVRNAGMHCQKSPTCMARKKSGTFDVPKRISLDTEPKLFKAR